mgnify:CR=1 FL=1
MDLLQLFGYEELTGMVQKFNYPELQLVPNLPTREIDGDIATWAVEKPDIEIYDTFGGRSMSAQPVRQGDYFEKTFTVPHRFASKTFDAGVLNQLEKFGTRDYDDNPQMNFIDGEIKKLDWRTGAYTDEYLVAQALQGSFTIKLGTSGNNLSKTIDFEIPAGNKFTGTVAWSTSATAKPLDDFQKAVDILGEYGVVPRYALMNAFTAASLGRTTEVQQFIRYYGAGKRFVEGGMVPPIWGIEPQIIRNRYASSGQTDGFKNKIIPDNKVLFIPDWPSVPGEWIEMQQCTFHVPNDLQNGWNKSVAGSATWARTTDSPTGLTVFHRVCRFPVIRKPWSVAIMTTS